MPVIDTGRSLQFSGVLKHFEMKPYQEKPLYLLKLHVEEELDFIIFLHTHDEVKFAGEELIDVELADKKLRVGPYSVDHPYFQILSEQPEIPMEDHETIKIDV